ncbi:MAG TPA: hypothetical protein VN030_01040 [Cellvibrio sp.]|nr:hypothetical protein [Cellvibrio sp.]
MSLFAQYRLYPQLSLCTALLLILGFLGAGFYLYNSDKNQQAQIERYGQLLAASSARQAVDATLTQDLVSLQAILQDVAQYPNVIGATLHNVENKLLVQSGYKPKQAPQGKRYNFTAPVALHNNVAGYLEVTIEVPRHTPQDDFFLLCWTLAVAGALLIIWWSIHRRWWLSLRDKLPSPADIVTAVVDKLPTLAEADIDSSPAKKEKPVPPAQIAVRLNLQIVNLNKLYQQLNSEGFETLLRRFETQMHTLLNLYNGERKLLLGDTLMIDFIGEEFHECSFRAICFAKILMNMTARNPSPRLQLAACIQPLAGEPAAEKSLLKDFIVQHNNSLSPLKNEIIISTSLIDDTLQEHAEFELNQGRLLLIKSPYSDYLAKQEEQLFAR